MLSLRQYVFKSTSDLKNLLCRPLYRLCVINRGDPNTEMISVVNSVFWEEKEEKKTSVKLNFILTQNQGEAAPQTNTEDQ